MLLDNDTVPPFVVDTVTVQVDDVPEARLVGEHATAATDMLTEVTSTWTSARLR